MCLEHQPYPVVLGHNVYQLCMRRAPSTSCGVGLHCVPIVRASSTSHILWCWTQVCAKCVCLGHQPHPMRLILIKCQLCVPRAPAASSGAGHHCMSIGCVFRAPAISCDAGHHCSSIMCASRSNHILWRWSSVCVSCVCLEHQPHPVVLVLIICQL